MDALEGQSHLHCAAKRAEGRRVGALGLLGQARARPLRTERARALDVDCKCRWPKGSLGSDEGLPRRQLLCGVLTKLVCTRVFAPSDFEFFFFLVAEVEYSVAS